MYKPRFQKGLYLKCMVATTLLMNQWESWQLPFFTSSITDLLVNQYRCYRCCFGFIALPLLYLWIGRRTGSLLYWWISRRTGSVLYEWICKRTGSLLYEWIGKRISSRCYFFISSTNNRLIAVAMVSYSWLPFYCSICIQPADILLFL